ncbi:MAG: 30S ribosomal protein S2 [Patescibacteria group bacterium]|jgi:small subunit ribosomal protein S2
MVKIPSVVEMLKAGVHFGHQSSKWHPKMKQFIFGERQGVHVINVEKTQIELEKTLSFVTNVVAKGGNILFVGTKRQAQEIVAKYASECGMPYVNVRWLGGTLTNFPQIQRLIRHYLDLKDKREKGELRKYTKLEQLQFDREIAELDEKIGGISIMTRLPDAVFILDARAEKTVVREATSVHIPIVALVDSNVNPTGIAHIIPGNDDASASIEMITKLVSEAVKEGGEKALTMRAASLPVQQSAEEDMKVSEKAQNLVEDMDEKVKEELAAKAREATKA